MEYFVSYYDYYQPEAYVPSTDTFIEKDSSINEEIERLRLAATGSLISRNDVIVIASVSCIYGLGSPDDFRALSIEIKVGQELERDILLESLIDSLYNRNDVELKAGKFRVRGDIIDIFQLTPISPFESNFGEMKSKLFVKLIPSRVKHYKHSKVIGSTMPINM